MRSRQPIRRTQRSYRPHLVPLEERLPLGDGLLGMFVGASLLPATSLAVRARSVSEGVAHATLAYASGSDASAWVAFPARGAEAVAGTRGLSFDSALAGDSPAAFGPGARRPLSALSLSPPREQGADSQPLLAPRANEDGLAPHAAAPTPPAATRPQVADGALLAILAALQQPAAPATAADVTPAQHAQVKENFGKLPLTFEQNVGQTDASVQQGQRSLKCLRQRYLRFSHPRFRAFFENHVP